MTATRVGRLWSPFGVEYRWVILASAFTINLFSAVLTPGVFAFFIVPMTADLGWARSELSLAITVRLLVAAVTGPALGQIIDRVGTRWLGAAMALVGGGALMALAGVDSLVVFLAIYGVSGVTSLGVPSGTLLTMVPLGKWFLRQRGRAMAIGSAGVALGSAIAIQAAQWLIATAGWRTAWLVFGAAMLVAIGSLSAILMRRTPEDHAIALDPLTAAHRDPRADWTRAQVLRTPTTYVILAALMSFATAIAGTLVYRVPYWQDEGIPPGLVALGVAADPLMVVASAVGFGLVAERVAVRYIGLVAGLGLALATLPLLAAGGGVAALVLHCAVWGLFVGAYLTTTSLIWVTYYGRRAFGAIQGVVLTGTIVASAAAMPLYGAVIERAGAGVAWSLTMALTGAAGVLLLLARPPHPAKDTMEGRA